MEILSPAAKARKHEAIGYALYIAHQPISACQNEQQRVGYRNAYLGEMAAAECETTDYLLRRGGN